MYCKKCGNQMEDTHKVCTQCGTPRDQGDDFCPSCGAKKIDNSKFCSSCGYNFSQGESEETQVLNNNTPLEPANTAPTQNVQQPASVQPPVQNNVPNLNQPPVAPVAPPVQPQQPQQAYGQQPQQQYPQPQQAYGQQPQQYQQTPPVQPRLKGYCRNCGTAFYANQAVCTQCGTKFGQGFSYCHHCGTAITVGSERCTQCGKSVAPPITGDGYFKSLGKNFTSIFKMPVLDIITRNLPNVLSLVALVLMFFPIVTYRHTSYSSIYGAYRIYSQYAAKLPGFSGFAVALIVLSLLVSIVLYEPFTRSFLDKNKTLSRLSYIFVPGLHLLAGGCIGLSYLIKGSKSLNSFINIPEYNGLSFTVMGWVLIGVLAVSVVAGCIAFFTYKNNNAPTAQAPVQQAPQMPQAPQNF